MKLSEYINFKRINNVFINIIIIIKLNFKRKYNCDSLFYLKYFSPSISKSKILVSILTYFVTKIIE